MTNRFAFAVVAVLSAVAALAELPSATFESRSHRYSLSADVTPSGEHEIAIAVRVTDNGSGSVVLAQTMTTADKRLATATSLADGANVRIQFMLYRSSLLGWLEVERDGTVIDAVAVQWAWKPHPKSATRTPPVPTATPARPPVATGEEMVSVTATRYPEALRVGGDVKAPIVIERKEPVYPEEARRARVGGIVILEAVIGKDGGVRDVFILKDLPFGLGAATADAVRQWKFKPATLNGTPVDVIFNLTTNFKLDERPDQFDGPVLGTPPPPPPPPPPTPEGRG